MMWKVRGVMAIEGDMNGGGEVEGQARRKD